jgi:hypothetical protein
MSAKRADLGSVTLRGNDHVDGSFRLAMVAAPEALGPRSGLDHKAVPALGTVVAASRPSSLPRHAPSFDPRSVARHALKNKAFRLRQTRARGGEFW